MPRFAWWPADPGEGLWDASPAEAAVYSLPPIDWWAGWTPLADLVACTDELDTGYVARLLVDAAIEAATLFTRNGWEGDGRWWAAPLPSFEGGAQEIRFLVGVKQSNNGQTFLWSPERLPWLDEWRCP